MILLLNLLNVIAPGFTVKNKPVYFARYKNSSGAPFLKAAILKRPIVSSLLSL